MPILFTIVYPIFLATASTQETFSDSVNERMNRKQGLPRSNLVLRLGFAQF